MKAIKRILKNKLFMAGLLLAGVFAGSTGCNELSLLDSVLRGGISDGGLFDALMPTLGSPFDGGFDDEFDGGFDDDFGGDFDFIDW